MTKIIQRECSSCKGCEEFCCVNCFVDKDENLFKTLSEEELKYLIDGKLHINFKRGETIIKQNTFSTHVVCIKKGMAKVYIEGVKDKNIILKLVGQSDFITGGNLFSSSVRQFTVSAITDVTCCFINSEKVIELYSRNKQFAIQLLKIHTHQNNILLSTLVNLTQKYMPGRVADSLLYLKNEIFKTNPFLLPLSRQDLADMSAMTKESYVRILKEFKTSGFIEIDRNSIEIIDEETLQSISKNG
jgi:CRP/FNR family transcriptional regulator, polysaccharide utilization system transcription regulator